MRHCATVVGPTLGGLAVAFLGFSASYGINAVSYGAIIGALLAMDPLPRLERRSETSWQLMLGGLRFVRRERMVLSMLALDASVGVLMSIRAVLPIYAYEILDVGAEGFGLFNSATALGAICGGLVLGATVSRWLHPAVILVISACVGLFTAGFGLSTVFALSLVMLFGVGFADCVGEIVRSTIVQLRTPDELRGRVTSFTTIFTTGGPQLGQLSNGGLVAAFGPVGGVVIAGTGILIVVGLFALNPLMRRPATLVVQTSAA
jgi:MFS family permease